MRQHFETEQWLPFPRELVFAFFANPHNLPPLMPAWQRARIARMALVPPAFPPPAHPPSPAASRGSLVAGDGTRLKITARIAPGVPLRLPWHALIRDFQWNEGFCDVQLKGPFAYWRHCHSVRDETRHGKAGTVIRDAVDYTLPLWPLSAPGTPVGWFAMRSLFRFRQRRTGELLPGFAKHVTNHSGSRTARRR